MYWYLDREEPSEVLKRLSRLEETGALYKLKDEEKIELATHVMNLESASGKNFYQPNEKERKFFLAPFRVKGISGGNRSGKTATLVLDAVMQLEGWHPLQKANLLFLSENAKAVWVRDVCKRILDDGYWIKSPPVYGRVITEDYPNYVNKVVGPEIHKWATSTDVKKIGFDVERDRVDLWKNGSKLEYLTYSQPTEAHAGSARDFIYADEEPPRDIWIESGMRTISTNGRRTIGMTAVNGVTWTEEDIWQPGLKKQGGVYAIEMTSYDNPMNSSEIIDEIKSHCFDAVEIAIRIYGKRQARGGLVLKTFSVKDMIEPFELPESCDLIVAIDPHPVTPHAVLFAWVDYDGLYHSIIDEKPNIYFVSGFFKTGHIPGLVSLIREREKLLGRSHDICLCDPSAWNENQKDRYEKSVADQLLEEDLVPLKGSKDLSGGILKMNEMFAVEMSYDGEQTKTREHPQAFIFQDEFVLQPRRDDSIQRLKWEFLNWRWPNPNQNMNMGNRIRRPIDRDDHMAECARRICEFVYDSRVEPLPMDPDWMTKKVRLGNGAVVDFSNAVTNELEVGL